MGMSTLFFLYSSEGKAWSTGSASSFQTGHLEPMYQFSPIPFQLSRYTQVAAGRAHSLFLNGTPSFDFSRNIFSENGQVSSIGNNNQGQLGYSSDATSTVERSKDELVLV
jgi:alpha-tubulin suppressor-like RCC1 family protein